MVYSLQMPKHLFDPFFHLRTNQRYMKKTQNMLQQQPVTLYIKVGGCEAEKECKNI